MSKSVRSRRLIALFAAYVVALQGLLLPLTVSALAAPESVVCVTAGDGTHPPLQHDAACPCAGGCGMQCGTPSLAGLLPPGVIIFHAPQVTLIAPPPAIFVAVASGEGIPHSPRAPPVV
jgi:hypothetical protein